MHIRERFVEVDGLRTRYLDACIDEGVDAPTIVLVPSMFLLARSYRPTMKALGRRGFRVVAIELPGTGGSSSPTSRWGFEDYAYWLVEAIETMGMQGPALIGHSVSGPVVLTAAARHGSRVGPIALCDSSGGSKESDSLWRVIPARCIDAIEELAFDLRATPDVLFNLAHHPRQSLNLFRLTKLSQARLAQRVHAPTLLAWGARDHTMPLRCARTIEQVMSNATTYVSREGSHDWIIERADEFAGAVDAFLGRCSCDRDTASEETITFHNYRATG